MTNREAAIRIVKKLRSRGHQALLAGGCVRDMLLGRNAKDYDVATSAKPNEVIAMFNRTLKIGAAFGVVMVIIKGVQVEVAAFRTESDYADGRHPRNVDFADAEQDAMRRDFTINGMFYDPIEKKVIDYVGGRKDLKNNVIRTIGNPDHRFSEDYLRMLRAVRFSTRLNFKIENGTFEAVKKNASKILNISAERIAIELEAVLTNPNRCRGLELFRNSGLCRVIFPDLNDNISDKGGLVMSELPGKIDFPLALSAFFSAVETEKALGYCSFLKLSNSHKKHIRFLLENRGRLNDADLPLAELKMLLSQPYFEDLYELQKAILKASGLSIRALGIIKKRAEKLDPNRINPKPLLDGRQLIDLGVRPGPMVGLVSRQLYIEQLSENIDTPDQAKQWVMQWLKNHKDVQS